MANLKKAVILCGYAITGAVIIHLLAVDVLAADNAPDWRPTFDLILRWVNFLILAFLLIKFGRAPIRTFLDGKKQEIAEVIETLEAEKQQILSQIDANQKQLDNSQERLAELKKRIIAQGEKNRQKIIAEAEQESKMLLKSAKLKVESRIEEARSGLKAEMVDTAIALAMERLPQNLTKADNQKFIDAFLTSALSK